MASSFYDRIYAAVCRIPAGRVATYGQVASAAGVKGQARLVGYALHSLPSGSDVPWHRVVNARGRISLDNRFGAGKFQRALLRAEGVDFDAHDKIDLARFGWQTAGVKPAGAAPLGQPVTRDDLR